MTPPVTLRPATPADVPALEALIAESARGLSDGFYTPSQTEAAVTHFFGVDSQLVADGTYLVAETAGEPVACGGWSRRRALCGGDRAKAGGPDPLLDPARDAARIRAFFVHPAWARRGIGRLLLAACERAAAAAEFTRLELISTLPGVPLYAAHGYAADPPSTVRLADGTDLPVVRMTKRLDARH
jgi:GNAT superfamily N-acetyltransferase